MAVISGQRFTTHQSTETRAVRDVKEEINQLEPDQYPLVAIMNKAKNRLKVTGNKKYEWFEDTLLPRFDVLGATELSAAATQMIVTNFAYFRKGDLVRVNKSELVYVTATPTTTTVTIRRAYGTTAAKIAAAGSQLHILANLADEGETIGDVLTTQKVPQFNYCALHKTPYKVSGTAQASDVYGKGDLEYEAAKAIIEHAKSIELLNILGELKMDTANETSLGVSRGILAFVTTNVKDVAILTEDEFEEFLRKTFRYGNKSKVLFASSKLCTVINGFSRDKLQTTSGEGTYGVTMTEYKNTGRKLMIVEHPLLENDAQTDLSGLMGTGIVLDLGDLSYRHMKGRYMKKDQVNPNADSTLFDGTVGQILTEGGLQLEQEKKHGLLTGVQE
jgi:hypothetical protein